MEDMRPAELESIFALSAPTLSPDGSRAVVAATRVSFTSDSYVGQLWEVPVVGGPRRRLTRGIHDFAPQFSPDGAAIAFLREVDGRPQLAVVEASGGEPRVLTDAPLGVREFAWSPDSFRIAFVAAMPEQGRYGTLEGVAPAKEDPRLVTGNKWRANGRGYTADKRQGIYVLDVPQDSEPWLAPVGRAAKDAPAPDLSGYPQRIGGTKGVPEALLLTPVDHDAAAPAFSPDGKDVYFVAALHPGADADIRSSIYRVSAAGGAQPELVVGAGALSAGEFTLAPDGTLYFLGLDFGADGLDFVGKQAAVYALAPGARAPRLLTDPQTEDFGGHLQLTPAPDGGVLALRRARGRGELIRVTDRGSDVVVSEDLVVAGVDAANGVLAVTYSTPVNPGELGVVAAGSVRPLTDFGSAVAAGAIAPQELTVAGSDGYPVHGWVFLPDDATASHPVLLNIHGGPHADYTWGYFDEAQVYARAGYAVVMCNPRGSAGYGFTHGVAIKERMGTVDMQDVLTFLDGALQQVPGLDGKRVGIMGGSYGGYLTAWTIAHTHRFTAAIVERGYLDPAAFVGTSDIGWFFSEAYTGTDPQHVAAQSPQAVVGQVRTPTLVIHSEEDWRCPPEQAYRYFTSLRRGGVETKLLLFPGENHELSRAGTPWHRRERFEHILAWWGHYLPVE